MLKTDAAATPTPDQFDDPLKQVLAFLYMRSSSGAKWMSSLTIYRQLLDEYGLYIHWRTIDKLLSEHGDLVRRKKCGKRWEYLLLSDGEKLVSYPESPIMLVDPAEAVQASASLHDALGSLKGEIRVCDPYLDEKTIQHLDACPTPSSISLLTNHIRASGKLHRTLAAAQTAGHNIEVRKDVQRTLHDRYIIDDESMLILGTSLNGFGKKQHFVIRCGDDIRQLTLADFDTRWANASRWT